MNEVLNHYKVPRPYNIIGIGMGGPTVIAWGTEEMKHRLLQAAREQRGDLVPAVQRARRGLRRRRPRDPRRARRRRVGRERPEGLDDARPHREVRDARSAAPTRPAQARGPVATSSSTCTQPGVEVRPLVQITGDAEFNEVFFNDARVRHDWMLGPRGRRLAGRDHDAHERAGRRCRVPVRSAATPSAAARSTG